MIDAPPVTPMYHAMQQACAEALQLPPEQWSFKTDKRYTDILEHVSLAQGLDHLHVLRDASWLSPAVLRTILERVPDIARDNDSMGRPLQYEFPELGCVCSPQNMQYVWHAVLFLSYLRDLGIRCVSVIELGGGYGGQALYTHRLHDLFDIDIAHYALVDIPHVIDIQRVFCGRLGVPVSTTDGRDAQALEALIASLPEPRILFSCYAFAEFEKPIKDWYVDKLVRHCPHGVMIWNTLVGTPSHFYPHSFLDLPMRVIEDTRPVYPGWLIWDVFW